MNVWVFALVVAALVPAGLGWVKKWRTPAVLASGALLLVALGLAFVLPVTVPRLGQVGLPVALALAGAGGGPLAAQMLAWADALSARDERGRPPVDADARVSPAVGLKGGAWIGVLERLGIAAALLGGWPEGIGVVLVVKGLGRYADLREGAAAERFIIGTFVSVLWAVAACAAVLVRPVP